MLLQIISLSILYYIFSATFFFSGHVLTLLDDSKSGVYFGLAFVAIYVQTKVVSLTDD